MAIDFQQVREQVKKLGESALQRDTDLKERRQKARELLSQHARDAALLIQRVERLTRQYDPNLRCALPAADLPTPPEALDQHFPLAALPPQATLIAADGSQINPNRHEQVNFGLVNLGAIQVTLGLPDPPRLTVRSHLIFDEELYTPTGMISEAQVALKRDLDERNMLVDLAKQAAPPVITFTDGPMELWGASDPQAEKDFEQSLESYLKVLRNLCKFGVTTAGYVDKPSANLVVRLLEIATLAEPEFAAVRDLHPLIGVSDRHLFQGLLDPGERSAVFAIHSRSAVRYADELALHFFYLNVGRPGKPWLARIEIPAWVAADRPRLDALHAVLFQQCQVLGSRPYPYLIHRAHETAVVSLEEKEQVIQMIIAEQTKRGVSMDEPSHKQAAKDLQTRTRYER